MADSTTEVPVNLPANSEDPKYGSDIMVDMIREMGFDYVTLTPGSTFRAESRAWGQRGPWLRKNDQQARLRHTS